MKYFLPINDTQKYGQLPIYDTQDTVRYFVYGKIGAISNHLFLTNLQKNELARLSVVKHGLIEKFEIKLASGSTITIQKLSSKNQSLLFLSKVNLSVVGNTSKGNYTFRHHFNTIAKVTTTVTDNGLTLTVDITNAQNEYVILLTTILLTQWHTRHLELPDFTTPLSYRPLFDN